MGLELAVDYGTVTIRGALVDRERGNTVAIAACPNPLSSYGPDILSRIAACGDSTGNREKVFDTAAAGLSDVVLLLTEKSTVDIQNIRTTLIAANTTHMFLLLREDPRGVSASNNHSDQKACGLTISNRLHKLLLV